METLDRITASARGRLRPPAKQPLSEWIESELRVPAEVSALPGKVRLWPFQKEIADAIGDPSIERVALVKPVRVGFSTLLTGAIGNFSVNDPSPILALLPTDDDARGYMVDDVEPIFDASPALSAILSGELDEKGRNTLSSWKFPGGSLKLVAAKAPRNLRRHNVRVLLIDEADAMEVTKEGSPVALAEKRTLSFPNRKIVIGSTPIFEETSEVLKAYAQSDQRIFEVPCPSCGAFNEIQWANIKWPTDPETGEHRPEGAYYECPHNGCVVEETEKASMVRKGRWRAQKPEVTGFAGFRLNTLVALLANASWGVLATEFLEAKKDPSTLQTFTNTYLAQGWQTGGEQVDEHELKAGAKAWGTERGAIPEDVLLITAGVDVQPDRVEVCFLGHSEDKLVRVLGHTVVHGGYHDDTTWSEVDAVLKTKWPHPLGGQIGIGASCVDSSDGNVTETVYSFCFGRTARRIYAIKGQHGKRQWIVASKSSQKGGKLYIVGVDTIKTHIRDRIEHGSIEFSADLEDVWYEQLASEKMVRRYVKGQPIIGHERIAGKDAEALDCVVYGLAASRMRKPNWKALREECAKPVGDKSGREDRLQSIIDRMA